MSKSQPYDDFRQLKYRKSLKQGQQQSVKSTINQRLILHGLNLFRSSKIIQFLIQIAQIRLLIVICMNSNSKRGWSQQEDSLLSQFVSRFGSDKLKWVEVAAALEKQSGRMRTGKQCRERWQHQLNPTIVRNQWTVLQQNSLFELQTRFGNKWALIAEHMPGRTDNAVKNYFYSAIRRVFTKVNLYLNKQRNRKHYKSIRQFQSQFLSKLMAVVDGNFDKKVRLVSSDTVGLAKGILAHIANLINHLSELTSLEDPDQSLDELVQKMHEFRRNCKKRKQKRKDGNQRQLLEQSEEEDSSDKREVAYESSCFSEPQTISRLNNTKYSKMTSMQRIIYEQSKMENQDEHTGPDDMSREGLSFKSTSRRETEEIIISGCNWQNESTNDLKHELAHKEDIATTPNSLPLFKTFSAIREEPKDRYWEFLDSIPNADDDMALGLRDLEEYEWNWGEENEFFPTYPQRENLLSASQSFDSTQIVTKFKMLEASLALEQCLLISRKSSRLELTNNISEYHC